MSILLFNLFSLFATSISDSACDSVMLEHEIIQKGHRLSAIVCQAA